MSEHWPTVWECNNCDWFGYESETRRFKHDNGMRMCPECGETCEMYPKDFKEVGDE